MRERSEFASDVTKRPSRQDTKSAPQTVRPPLLAVANHNSHRIPLTFAQSRLWFLLQMEGASEAYHVPMCIRIRGRLDETALRRALDRIVERHEILRTRFEQIEDEVFQRVETPTCGLDLRCQDLSDCAVPDPRLREIAREELLAPFDLKRGPIARGRLIRVAPADHLLMITLHHIGCDGWSMVVIAQELAALYPAYIRGGSDPLATLPLQYGDYAAWQRQWLSSHCLAKEIAFWRNTLTDAPPLLELPTDRPRPPVQQFGGAMCVVDLDERTTAKLQAVAKCHDATLFMVVLAGWAVVLARLSGQQDIVIGVPTSNRLHSDCEGLIGLFVNTLAIRVDLSGRPLFSSALERTRNAVIEAQSCQEVPFEQVVEALKPARSVAYTPLFQVMLAWQHLDTELLRLPDLQISMMAAPVDTAKYDLTLDLVESGGRISGGLNYATSLFDADTAERHVGYLKQVLTQISMDALRSIDALQLLTAQERRRVVTVWNDSSVDYPSRSCIHELFEGQVARAPDAVALVDANRSMTYAQINAWANRLAWRLRQSAITTGALVGLYMERSPESVIGMLAIWKAGAAYVPLDPSYPPARLQYILRDAALAALLTQRHLSSQLQSITGCRVLVFDDELNDTAGQENMLPLAMGLTPDNPAYVVYTSGSTGEPKGVVGEHRGMVNRITAQGMIAPYASDDICCHKTSIGFIDSIFEAIGPLAHGLPLVVLPQAATLDIEQLGALIQKAAVTRMICVPSMARSIVDNPIAVRLFGSLRQWTLSGEELTAELLRKLQEEFPQCGFVNIYGSSEVAADATWYQCGNVLGERVPIGRPISNTQVYILDTNAQPVPIGVVGEIYVAGVGLAQGYLHRPDLTAERFVSNPFTASMQDRMYRTGDLGRWKSNGMIEYVGRSDHQVKLRGCRIELGEIEIQLAKHPRVKETVVVAREDYPGQKHLVVYAVLRDKEAIDVDELRAHLSAVLPEYMVPHSFVILEHLPLTSSGKVDRRMLQVSEAPVCAIGHYGAPQGTTECVLANIWEQLLGIQEIGRNDNFFALGGHSLLLAGLVARISEQFEVPFEIRIIFQNPSIKQLANVIERLQMVTSRISLSDEVTFEQGSI